MISAIDQLIAKFKKDTLLEMVTGNIGEGKELHRLQSVLEPSQVAMGCAMAWGYRPPMFLATYRGSRSGSVSHAVARL